MDAIRSGTFAPSTRLLRGRSAVLAAAAPGKRCRVRGLAAAVAAALAVTTAWSTSRSIGSFVSSLRPMGRSGGCSSAGCAASADVASASATAVDVKDAEPLQARATFDLLRKQSRAGFAMKDLGIRMENARFEATALDGKARAVYNGAQRLRMVEVQAGALEAASGDATKMAAELLAMLQKGHDDSFEASRGEVWSMYKENGDLMQAPLTQLGAGNTVVDAWANVTATEETMRMTTELFERFDVDKDGYWNWAETAQVQMATEGTEMAEDAFNALIIAAAPDGGRDLSEEDLAKGLSRETVIELYTNAQRQKKLGFVLNIQKDYDSVFNKPAESETPPPAKSAPVVVD